MTGEHPAPSAALLVEMRQRDAAAGSLTAENWPYPPSLVVLEDRRDLLTALDYVAERLRAVAGIDVHAYPHEAASIAGELIAYIAGAAPTDGGR